MNDRQGAYSEWRAGWPLPPVAALGVAVASAPAYALGMFFAPLEQAFGWSRAQTSSGLFALSAVAIVTIPLMGRLVDLRGARRIALPSMILFSLAFAALALAQPAIWTWWGLWMLLALAGAGINPVVWTAAVASRFDKGRGLAMAITLSGAGIGTAAAPVLSAWLIGAYGWRTAYVGMGALFALVMLPLMLLFFHGAGDLQRRTSPGPEARGAAELPGMTFREGLRHGKFQRLVAATFLIAFGLLALVVHFVPIVTSAGLSTTQAAEAAALIGAGSITGRLFAGILLDRVSATLVGCAAFLLPVLVALALLQWAGDAAMIVPVALLLGLSLGSEVDVVAYLASRHVGLKRFGALFGICMSAMALATGVGPWVAGLIFDAFGNYDYFLVAAAPLFLTAALFIASLGTKARY